MRSPPEISPELLEAALDQLPGERVTEDYIRSRIAKVTYHQAGETTIACVIELDNGWTSVAAEGCVDPANFRRELGEAFAFRKALDQLWPLFGFLLKETRWRREVGSDQGQR